MRTLSLTIYDQQSGAILFCFLMMLEMSRTCRCGTRVRFCRFPGDSFPVYGGLTDLTDQSTMPHRPHNELIIYELIGEASANRWRCHYAPDDHSARRR